MINRIDPKELGKNGQKDGAVMFCSVVDKSGEAMASWTYKGTPGSGPLEEEVNKRFEGLKFIPAIYNYQPVGVLLYGTVVFSFDGLKPRIRIFLNQDPRELKESKDFIGPQPVIGGESKFDGLTPPQNPSVPLTAVVGLGLKVDAKGDLQDLQLIGEDPPLLGYGDAALADFREAKFIPAFRDGDPAASDTILPVCYKPTDEQVDE